MKLRTVILIGCLLLSVFLTCACLGVDGDDCTRLDGTNGCEVIEQTPKTLEEQYGDAW